nr:hypothetical protein Iba_chr09fCG1930 [Ipomoea batatas]
MTVKVGISSLNFQFTTSSILSEITLFGKLNCLQHVNEFPTAISSHSIVLAAFVDYGNWEAIGKGSCFLNPISTLRLRNLDGIEIFLVVSSRIVELIRNINFVIKHTPVFFFFFFFFSDKETTTTTFRVCTE